MRYSYFLYPPDLYDESLREYTLMPMHMKGFFTARELETAEFGEPLDFTKDLRVLRIHALNEARRPPGLDGTKFAAFPTALYHTARDPHQLHPIDDPREAARLRAGIVRSLRAHGATSEFYRWMGLEHNGVSAGELKT